MMGIIRPHLKCNIYHPSNAKNPNSIAKIPGGLYKDLKHRYSKEIAELTNILKVVNSSEEPTLEEIGWGGV